jgi:hypothetical protein
MGFFDEEIPAHINFPKISKHLERQIGAFVIAWGVLERELNISFPILFRVDPTLAGCIYSNLGTRAKLDILESGVDCLSLLLGSKHTKLAMKLLGRAGILNTKARNTIAHGIREPFYDEETKTSEWILVRLISRKKQSWIKHRENPAHWRRLTKAVLALSKSWHRKNRAMHERLKRFSDLDLQENVLIHSKDAEPIVLRSRNRRPPKKGGSQRHQPNLEIAS